MKNKWLFIAMLFPLLSFSQDKSRGYHFNTVVSGGLIAGESVAKPLFQVSSGLIHGRSFTGIGAGLDLYNLKSIPVFADYRMSFGKARSIFLYANGGYNFPFGNVSNVNPYFKTSDRFTGGLYMDAGMGYRFHLNSLHRILFSAGYSRKNINNEVSYISVCFNPPCTDQVYIYHYNYGRIVTKLSWEFGK